MKHHRTVVIQQIQIMQEKYSGQRIELSVEPNGYCYVTRSDGHGNTQPIAEGVTLGDVFELLREEHHA